MTEENEPILDNKKILEKISKLEQLSQDLIYILNDNKNNNEIIAKNKEFINYLYEHQNIKDMQFFMLYPNMNIVEDNKNGVFHELQRKDSIQYIQSIISKCIKEKENIEKKANEIKKNLIDAIEDPIEMDILDKEIYDIILPLASKKFPRFLKKNDEDEIDSD